MFQKANKAIEAGVSILILSDRNMNKEQVAIPTLLAVSALHQELIRQGHRSKVSLIVETGEAREVHHFAALIGFGADAINPYLAFATYKQAVLDEKLSMSYEEAVTKIYKTYYRRRRKSDV